MSNSQDKPSKHKGSFIVTKKGKLLVSDVELLKRLAKWSTLKSSKPKSRP